MQFCHIYLSSTQTCPCCICIIHLLCCFSMFALSVILQALESLTGFIIRIFCSSSVQPPFVPCQSLCARLNTVAFSLPQNGLCGSLSHISVAEPCFLRTRMWPRKLRGSRFVGQCMPWFDPWDGVAWLWLLVEKYSFEYCLAPFQVLPFVEMDYVCGHVQCCSYHLWLWFLFW